MRAIISLSLLVGTLSPANAQQLTTELSAPTAALEMLEIPLDHGRALVMSRAIRLLHSSPREDPAPSRTLEVERLLLDLDVAEGQDSRTSGHGLTVTSLPLPLDPETWAKIIFERVIPPRALFSSIIRDRDASLLYSGLQAMTPATLNYLTKNPETLRHFYRDSAGAVAGFGGSFRIGVDGAVIIPGGADAVELWESLVGEPISRPDRFGRALFGRDAGRLAYFFNAMTMLDEPHRRFALGLKSKDRGKRLDRFRALYTTFVAIDEHWAPSDLPFARPPYDPATMLAVVAVNSQGELSPPSFKRLWARAFDGSDLPEADRRDMRAPEADGVADAAWLAEQLSGLVAPERRFRLERLAFGQRVFSASTPAQLPEVLVALRGFGRFPTVMLALERIGIRRPDLYGRMARRALSIERVAEPSRSLPLLSQFQGALALLERLARTGAVRRDALESLVASLSALGMSDGGYHGQLTEWLRTQLLPSLAQSRDTDPSNEDRLLEALTDPLDSTAAFSWEGESYLLDASVSLRDLKAVRAKQGGNTLDAVLALAADARALAQAPHTLAQIKARITALRGDAGKLTAPRPWPDNPQHAPELEKTIDRAVNELSKISKEGDLSQTARIAKPLVELADYLMGETLVALVYAPVLGDAAGILGPSADVSHRHTFGVGALMASGNGARHIAWVQTSAGSRAVQGEAFTGSLLGIDLALARKKLRRLATDRLPSASKLNSNDSVTLTNTLALLNPRTLTNAQLSEIGNALARGRERVANASRDPSAFDALAAEARMSDTRRQLVAWTIAQEPDQLTSLVSVGELFWLGAASRDEGKREHLNAWGVSHQPLSGCYCLRFPEAGSWDLLAGRESTNQLAAGIPDLNLAVAGLLSELEVPAALFPGVMSWATQDYVDTAPAMYYDDWVAISGQAWQVSRERVEDYVSALVVTGPVRRTVVSEGAR